MLGKGQEYYSTIKVIDKRVVQLLLRRYARIERGFRLCN